MAVVHHYLEEEAKLVSLFTSKPAIAIDWHTIVRKMAIYYEVMLKLNTFVS